MGYPIVDISNWPHENINVSGSKEKRWYRSVENNQLALFKLPISVTSGNLNRGGDSTGEAWSEKICSEIGDCINFSTHKVDIGALSIDQEAEDYYGINSEYLREENRTYGALCWSFLDENKDSLVEGADMIMDFDETYNRDTLQGKYEIYNFDLLYRLFNHYGILDNLFKMILFDTLVGNTDRHQDNFGVIRNEETGHHKFAPLYDNSSSLGRELTEERIVLMLKDDHMFNSYIFGKRSSTLIRWGETWIKKGLNILEFYEKVKETYPDQINKHIENISTLSDSLLEEIISSVPQEVMSEPKKVLVKKILETRRNYLLK